MEKDTDALGKKIVALTCCRDTSEAGGRFVDAPDFLQYQTHSPVHVYIRYLEFIIFRLGPQFVSPSPVKTPKLSAEQFALNFLAVINM